MESHDAECEKKTAKNGDGCKCLERLRVRNYCDLHRLWTAALPSPAYDKKAWLNIESQLISLNLMQAPPPTPAKEIQRAKTSKSKYHFSSVKDGVVIAYVLAWAYLFYRIYFPLMSFVGESIASFICFFWFVPAILTAGIPVVLSYKWLGPVWCKVVGHEVISSEGNDAKCQVCEQRIATSKHA